MAGSLDTGLMCRAALLSASVAWMSDDAIHEPDQEQQPHSAESTESGSADSRDVPTELSQTLADNPEAKEEFDQLEQTHQDNYKHWVDKGTNEQARNRAADKAAEILQERNKAT